MHERGDHPVRTVAYLAARRARADLCAEMVVSRGDATRLLGAVDGRRLEEAPCGRLDTMLP